MFEQLADANRTTYALTLGAFATASSLAWLLLSRKPYVHKIGGKASPPGPKRNFFVGNAFNFPGTAWLDKFAALQEQYGDVVYFQIPGRPILVLNSFDDAEELLNKRANIWSDRPHNYMTDNMMAFGWSLVLIAPGEAHNEMRKIFRQVLGPRTVMEFDTMIEEAAKQFHKALHGFSGNPEHVISTSIGSFIIRMAYGDTVHRLHGPELVKLNAESVPLITWANSQIWLVNVIPLARFLPSWLPGLKFHAFAKKGKAIYDRIRYWTFNHVKLETEEEPADLCVVTKYISDDEKSNGYLRDATALMYMGGVDTTSASLQNFIANMLMHPHVQKKIHAELDEVVGRGHIPTMADVSSLVYLRAAWNESLRTTPTLPVSTPHTSTQEDTWKGYILPKGTMILPNQAFMLRDPRHWGQDSAIFRPERFLEHRTTDLPDLETLVFGWGRRRCPGRYVAERNGMLFAATALAAYQVVPVEGVQHPLDIRFTDDKIRRPSNLQCSFVSR